MVDLLKESAKSCGTSADPMDRGDALSRFSIHRHSHHFDETDLENAISLGLLRNQNIVGSFEWEY
jgi:hypothetical protein